VEREGRISLWSPQAESLLGYPAEAVIGTSAVDLLATPQHRKTALVAIDGHAAGQGWGGVLALRHRDGHELRVALCVRPVLDGDGPAGWSVNAADAQQAERAEIERAILQALFSQSPMPITVMDDELRHRWVNVAAARATDMPAERLIGQRIGELAPVADAQTIERVLRQVRDTGEPVFDFEVHARHPADPDREVVLSGSSFRLRDPEGRPLGMFQTYADITEAHRARRRLALLTEAGARIGATLDVVHTAQDVANVLVPAFGDLVAVDLAEAVFDGDEPMKIVGGGKPHLRRAAVAAADNHWPDNLLQPGATAPALPDTAKVRLIQRGRTIVADRKELIDQLGDPRLVDLYVPKDGQSLAVTPLFARGFVLGAVTIWRTDPTKPFDEEDAELLGEIASRAALSVDNARRYTREHRAAAALQQQLLPPAQTDTAAGRTEGFYLPAGGGAEISGDWFDVIPLPSLRTALVIGDVTGHGLHATATMGRLRTGVQTLADLELDPTELLTRLDELVTRLAAEADPAHRDTVGATCLYAVYDPVTRSCAFANAGHPPPVLVHPDGTTRLLEISSGAPLGTGGMPFETTTIEMEPGSILALYTDGLIERDSRDIDAGLRRLTDDLTRLCRPGRPLGDIGRALLYDVGDQSPPRDDIALLLARVGAVPPDSVATWEFPADPAVVADAREATARQLAIWGLEELAFSTELVVSELVTNAIRYAGGPIGLRLIRENVLVCEVTDPSNTQPRLRRARWTDEGGRGLYLVAQLTARWGSRYGRRGKTIWAEQPLSPAADQVTSLPWAALF
jgi:PAS domain S-box-containing protein